GLLADVSYLGARSHRRDAWRNLSFCAPPVAAGAPRHLSADAGGHRRRCRLSAADCICASEHHRSAFHRLRWVASARNCHLRLDAAWGAPAPGFLVILDCRGGGRRGFRPPRKGRRNLSWGTVDDCRHPGVRPWLCRRGKAFATARRLAGHFLVLVAVPADDGG